MCSVYECTCVKIFKVKKKIQFILNLVNFFFNLLHQIFNLFLTLILWFDQAFGWPGSMQLEDGVIKPLLLILLLYTCKSTSNLILQIIQSSTDVLERKMEEFVPTWREEPRSLLDCCSLTSHSFIYFAHLWWTQMLSLAN